MERVLFENANHKFILLGFKEAANEGGVPTNQYLIVNNRKGILLDPGGFGLYPKLSERLLNYLDSTEDLVAIFVSHQDPDVAGGVGTWLRLFTEAKVYMSHVWYRFIPHYNIDDASSFIAIDDRGGTIKVGDAELLVVPAYFNHSPGNLNIYDPISNILFSGDIGAGADACPHDDIWVADWFNYSKCITPFHRRYMSSNKTLRLWVNLVRELSPSIIAPQHGYLYKGSYVENLLDFLWDLRCGVDVAEEFYPKTLKKNAFGQENSML